MNHEDLKGLVLSLNDPDLTADERRQAQEHMGRCAECRAALAGWGHARRALLEPLKAQAGEDFTKGVLARLDQRAVRPRDILFRWAAPWAAPGLALAGALLLLLWEPSVSFDYVLEGGLSGPVGSEIPSGVLP